MKRIMIMMLALLLSKLSETKLFAQCTVTTDNCSSNLSITGLPSILEVCQGTTFTLLPEMNTPSPLSNLTYTWSTTPVSQTAAVSAISTSLNTQFNAGTTSQTICLTATAFGPNQIANGDFSLGNNCFTTGYTYDNRWAPPGFYFLEGSYTVNSSSAGLFNGAAPACAMFDHTTGSGNMLLANSSMSGTPIRNVWGQSVSVCPGATYKFSLWSANWNVPTNIPVLEVLFDNVVVGTLTVNATCGTWQELSFEWTNSSSTTINIAIRNTNTAGGDNDFALDDISLRRISRATRCVTTNPVTMPIVGTLNPITLCEDEATTFSFSGSTTLGGLWSGTAGLVSISGSTSPYSITGHTAGSTVVTYSITNACGHASTTMPVTVNPVPVVYSTITELTGAHCEGATLVFSFTTIPGAIIEFESTPGGPAIGLADGTGVFTYSMTATAPLGKVRIKSITDPTTGCKLLLDIAEEVCVDPEPHAIAITGPAIACQGDVNTFTIHGYGWGSGTPVWSCSDPTAAVLGTSVNTINLYGGGPGTVTVTYSLTNCCGSTAVTTDILIKPTPIVTDIDYAGCKVPCPGTPLIFKIKGTPGATISWGWVDPCCSTLVIEPSITLDASGQGTIIISGGASVPGTVLVHLISAELNGCYNYNLPNAQTPVELPYAKICSEVKPGCEGDCYKLTICGTPGATVELSGVAPSTIHTSVTLDENGVGITKILCPGETTTYTITGIYGTCCYLPITGGPTVTVVQYPNPVMSLTATPNPYCPGSTVTLHAGCVGCTGPLYWDGPHPSLPTATLPSAMTYSLTAMAASYAGTYSVTGSYTPQNTKLTCKTTVTTDVKVDTAAIISLACNGTLCESKDGTIVLNFSGPAGAIVTYNSTPAGYGGVTTLNATGSSSVTVTVLSAYSAYTFTVTGATSPGSCASPATGATCTASFNHAPPICPLVYNSSTGTIDVTTSVAPGNYIVVQPFDITYSIIGSPITIPSSSFLPAVFLPSGTKVVRLDALHDGNCYWNGFDCSLELPVPVPRPSVKNEISQTNQQNLFVYPNPNDGTFTISGNVISRNASWVVFDEIGRSIKSGNFDNIDENLHEKIVLDRVSPGVYTILVTAPGYSGHAKILVK